MRSIRKSNKTFKKRGKFGGKKNGKRKTMKTKRGKGAKKSKKSKKSKKMKRGGGSTHSGYYVLDNGMTGDVFKMLNDGILMNNPPDNRNPRQVEQKKLKKTEISLDGTSTILTLYIPVVSEMFSSIEPTSCIELTNDEFELYKENNTSISEKLIFNKDKNELIKKNTTGWDPYSGR
jgi:hypothetical protein